MSDNALFTFGNVLSVLIIGGVLLNTGLVSDNTFRTIAGAIVILFAQVMLLMLSADAAKKENR